jgi:Putative DNA-binding domain
VNSAFAAALLDPDIEIPAQVTGPDGGRAPKRYGVYRNNVVVSLMEALRAAFPSVLAIMGEENFARVARNFVALHPPRSPLMQCYGEAFAAFLDGFAPLRSAPYLGDVARVERACLDAFHAADAARLSTAELSGLSPGDTMALKFAPHPAAALLRSSYAVADLHGWRNGRPDGGTDVSKPQAVMVTRPVLQVDVHALTIEQHAFLSMLVDGRTFGEAAAAALGANPQMDLSGTFALALTAGLFLPLEQSRP